MARPGTLLVFTGMLLATFCFSSATARSLIDLDVDLNLDINLKLNVVNEASKDVVLRLLEGAKDAAVEAKKGAQSTLGPVQVKLGVGKILNVEVALLKTNGQLVKAVAKVCQLHSLNSRAVFHLVAKSTAQDAKLAVLPKYEN